MDPAATRGPIALARLAWGGLTRPPWRLDLALAVVVWLNEMPWLSLAGWSGAAHACLVSVQCAALLRRRTSSLATLLVVTGIADVLIIMGREPADDLSVPGLFAGYAAACYAPRGAVTAAALAAAAGGLVLPGGVLLGRWDAAAGLAVIFGVVLALGLVVRQRRAAAAEAARQASSAEAARVSLARQVHDVVSQSMSAVALQAAAAARSPGTVGADAMRERFVAINATARDALSEMTLVVEALRAPAADRGAVAATRGVGDLPALVERFRGAGQEVVLLLDTRNTRTPDGERAGSSPDATDDVTDDVPDEVQAVAYAVVSEGLANALRHAPGVRVTVTVSRDVDVLTVRLGHAVALPPARDALPPGGHGLLGLRERVAAVGGRIVAAPRPGGGFDVVARLPLATDPPAASPGAPPTAPTRAPWRRQPRTWVS